MATNQSSATAILRLVPGIVVFAHGVQKMLGWFGSYGFAGAIGFPTEALHRPSAIAAFAIAAEFFGGLGLIVGFLTRVVAAGIAVNVAVDILMVDSNDGFSMNWSGAQNRAGFDCHLLALAIALFLMLQGAGSASVDRVLFPSARTLSTYSRHDKDDSSTKDKTTQEIVMIGKSLVLTAHPQATLREA